MLLLKMVFFLTRLACQMKHSIKCALFLCVVLQTRKALFDAIAEGRAEGEGVPQVASRIVDYVESGHWQTPEMRAQIIARNGSIVSAAEASQLAADEHPNGTLSFAPYFGEDD